MCLLTPNFHTHYTELMKLRAALVDVFCLPLIVDIFFVSHRTALVSRVKFQKVSHSVGEC